MQKMLISSKKRCIYGNYSDGFRVIYGNYSDDFRGIYGNYSTVFEGIYGNYSTEEGHDYGNFSIFFSKNTVRSATSFSRREKTWSAP